MTKTDHVKSPIKEPDSVRVYEAPGLLFPTHGKIDDLDGFSIYGGIVYLVQNSFEFAVFFVWLYAHVKRVFDIFQIFSGFGRKAALSANTEGSPSVGLGTDFRLESGKVTGFALAVDDQLLHISV